MSWYRVDTDVHKIFRCKVSLKCRCQSRCLVIVDKELWTSLRSSTFGILFLKKQTITAAEVVLTQLRSYSVSKHKNKKQKHRISWHLHIIQKLPLLKPRESHFSPVWIMEFSIISSCLSKVKVLPITLTW